jgi:protein involved in polysaccharide export with SLBB domain
MKTLFCLCFALAGLTFLRAADTPAAYRGAPSNMATQAPTQAGASADYVLAPSDLLEVKVMGEPDLLAEVRISRDGTIKLNLINEINLTNKTLRQAEDMIRDLYGKDYLVNPQVNLMVKEYSKRTVTVLGEVVHAGPVSFPLEQGLSLVDAISAAGGLTQLAKLSNVKITRPKPNGDPDIFIVDFNALINGDKNKGKGEKKNDFPLMINDIVYVDQIFFVK